MPDDTNTNSLLDSIGETPEGEAVIPAAPSAFADPTESKDPGAGDARTSAGGLPDLENDVSDAPAISPAEKLAARRAEVEAELVAIGNPYTERDAINRQMLDKRKAFDEAARTHAAEMGRLGDRFRAADERAGQEAERARVLRLELESLEAQTVAG